MTDFRALCEELLDELELWSSWHDATDLKDRAGSALHFALGEQPVGPTDEELKAAYWEAFKNSAACGAEESWLAGLRAVARWGTSNLAEVRSSLGDHQLLVEDDVDLYLEQ
jgi:hypothetical protein